MMSSSDTIVAAATPFGYSGVAIVRISGPQSFKIGQKLTKKPFFKPRLATLSSLYDLNDNVIDTSLLTAFKSPSSYTGENTLEISCHGNPALIAILISTICSLGARPADAGEFTFRAFINGKIDLIQAEGVASLIHAKSLENIRIQQNVVSGDFSSRIALIRNKIINLLSTLEYEMDISEEDIDPSLHKDLFDKHSDLLEELSLLANSFAMGGLLNSGIRVVITGPPNVGKSSLLNFISGTSRAIVSKTPGTTRDLVDVELLISGVPIKFVDTAGIRKSKNTVEEEGVRRALLEKKRADLVLSVSDNPSLKPKKNPEKPTLYIVNKSDLHAKTKTSKPVIHISCKKKQGLKTLISAIKKTLKLVPIHSDSVYLSTPRQNRAILSCKNSLSRASVLIKSKNLELELLSFELREAIDALDSLFGKTTPNDIINNIFSTLCVGK